MMQIAIDFDAMSLTAEGHAEYAEAGQDIVCAGASALICTLGERLQSKGLLGEDSHVMAGDVFFQAIDTPMARTYLDFAAGGLQMLAEQYPQNVSVILLG